MLIIDGVLLVGFAAFYFVGTAEAADLPEHV
jgi:hypothetical protein